MRYRYREFRKIAEFLTRETTPFYEIICRSFVIGKLFCRSFQAFFDRQAILSLIRERLIRVIKGD